MYGVLYSIVCIKLFFWFYEITVSAFCINVLYEPRVVLECVVRVLSVCCINVFHECCIFCVVFITREKSVDH